MPTVGKSHRETDCHIYVLCDFGVVEDEFDFPFPDPVQSHSRNRVENKNSLEI